MENQTSNSDRRILLNIKDASFWSGVEESVSSYTRTTRILRMLGWEFFEAPLFAKNKKSPRLVKRGD